MFWEGKILVMITNDFIHKLARLKNICINPFNEKNVKKLVEINIESTSYGRNMRFDTMK